MESTIGNDTTMENTSVHSASTNQQTNDTPNVTFAPIENDETFVVPKEYAQLIQIIDVTKFRCDVGIKKSSLKIILEYCTHHINSPPALIQRPLLYNDFSKCISDKWDYDFIMKIDIRCLFELANDCDSVKCPSLLSLCCARIGHYFRCESPEELKKTFGLTASKFTKEESEDMIKGNPWLMDMLK